MTVAASFNRTGLSYRYSYQHNREGDSQRVPNIGTLMLFPYARILPMHLTIGLANSMVDNSGGRLLIKTGADIIMHMVEHADARQKKRV